MNAAINMSRRRIVVAALLLTSYLQASNRPYRAASMRGVFPSVSTSSKRAPARKRRSIIVPLGPPPDIAAR